MLVPLPIRITGRDGKVGHKPGRDDPSRNFPSRPVLLSREERNLVGDIPSRDVPSRPVS